MRRLMPYFLLALLVLGTGLGIGLGLSEAPTQSTRVVISTTPKLLPAKDHYLIAVFMKVGATIPKIAAVRAALRQLATTSSCGYLSTQAARRKARELLSPGEYAALTPTALAAQVGCLVTVYTPATRSLVDWLSRQPDVREVQVSYLGQHFQRTLPEAAGTESPADSWLMI